MLNLLILKLNATGDVARPTTLLHRLRGQVTSITAAPNTELFAQGGPVRCIEWAERQQALDRHYDLVINLEDEEGTAQFAKQARHTR